MKKPNSSSRLTSEPIPALPTKISKAREFEKCVLTIRCVCTGTRGDEERFLGRMYYLLGWLVGDAGKGFTPRELFKVRMEIGLCKGHPENSVLGQYVIDSLGMLGVLGNRIADGLATIREPHGSFRLQSRYLDCRLALHSLPRPHTKPENNSRPRPDAVGSRC